MKHLLCTHLRTGLDSISSNARPLETAEVKKIAWQIEHSKRVAFVTLNNAELNSDDALFLGQALAHCTLLIGCYLPNNHLDDQGVVHLLTPLTRTSPLRELDVSNNQLSEDGADAIADFVLRTRTLESLDISDNDIGAIGFIAIMNALRRGTRMQHVVANHCSIGDDAIIAIVLALRRGIALVTLDLQENTLGDGVIALLNELRLNQSLQRLTLSIHFSHNISNALGMMLMRNNTLVELQIDVVDGCDPINDTLLLGIAHNRSLQSLKISGNAMSSSSFTALCDALIANSHITQLSFQRLVIGDKGAASLADLIRMNVVTLIEIKHCRIKRSGAFAIAQALRVNTSLTFLTMFDDEYSSDGCAEIVSAVRSSRVQEFQLDQCEVNDDAATQLAHTLRGNSALRHVSLMGNFISDVGAASIANALENNVGIEELLLDKNLLSAVGLCALLRALEANNTLRLLSLSQAFNSSASIALAKMIERNQTLNDLNLIDCVLFNSDALLIAAAIKKNSSLSSLSLAHNKISEIGAIEFAQALENNFTLLSLDLSNNVGITQYTFDRIAQLVQRNCLLAELNIDLKFLEQQTKRSIVNQNGDDDWKMGDEFIEHPQHVDVSAIYAAFRRVLRGLQRFINNDLPLPRARLIELQQTVAFAVVNFGINSIDPHNSLQFPHIPVQLQAALEAFSQLEPNHVHYANAAFFLGDYFFRAHHVGRSQQACAQTATRFFNVCMNSDTPDENARDNRECATEHARITALAVMKIRHLQLTPGAQPTAPGDVINDALTQPLRSAREVPAQQPFDLTALSNNVKTITQHAVPIAQHYRYLYAMTKLRALVAVQITLSEYERVTRLQFFSHQQRTNALRALAQRLNGKRVDLTPHYAVLIANHALQQFAKGKLAKIITNDPKSIDVLDLLDAIDNEPIAKRLRIAK